MNAPTHELKKLIAFGLLPLLLSACSQGPTRPAGADQVRSKLIQLQSDPQLATRAPVAIKEAELAVKAAEELREQDDMTQGEHLVFMADHKVEIAAARAQSRLAEDQRKTLSEQREKARLDSRTLEADKARNEATIAREEADIARSQAELANLDTQTALQNAADLQQQIDELNAKATDRGLVVTLGDLLFDTGKSNLKGGTENHLSKLAAFLNKHQDRTVIIEGHTDNVGSSGANVSLSERRANSVKSYLMNQGVAASRLESYGLGEDSPVAGNDSASGRRQNRRVEVIIANTASSPK